MTQTLGWTRADQAELEVLIWHIIEAAEAHRWCQDCYRLGRWCPPLADAWMSVEDWRNRRRLLSRADWLRAEQKKCAPALDTLRNEAHNDPRLEDQ